jgi:hypothetical protein
MRKESYKISVWFVTTEMGGGDEILIEMLICNVKNNLINTINKLTYVYYSLLSREFVSGVLRGFFNKWRWLPLLLLQSG